LTKAKEELGPCQVRSETHHPCPRPAVAKIWGMLFCERCAHEQEAYFAIGELTQGESHGLRNEPLVEALDQMLWWERTGRITAAGMEKAKVTVGDPQ
jgi:hypothetical protein